MYINGIEVGDSLLYYPATGGTGSNTVKTTGTVQVKNTVEDLTGSITVLLKLYDHDAAYPNGNAQGTFRMDDFVLNGYVNDDGGSVGGGYQYANRGGYRYGFNGQEKSDEIFGEGNAYDFGERIQDPRLGGRWFSTDPLQKDYPFVSPYSYGLNNPIKFIDVKGEFVIDPAFKLAYPTVSLILENADKIYCKMDLPDDVKKALKGVDYNKVFNDIFKASFQEVSTGTDAQICEMLTKDKGPNVISFPRVNERGEEISNGDYFSSTDQINISPEIAGVLEFELAGQSKENPLNGLGGVTQDDGDNKFHLKFFQQQFSTNLFIN